ncbi:MAG: hypothetical protein ACJ8OJ_22690 [Povalibacter sp.]
MKRRFNAEPDSSPIIEGAENHVITQHLHTSRPNPTFMWEVRALAVNLLMLTRERWQKRKHGYVWRRPRCVSAGIAVTRSQSSSMVSNTCCTMLMATSAPGVAKSAANPP